MEILSLALVGAVIAALVQFLKSTVGPITGYKTVLVCAVLSLFAAGIYQQFHATVYWQEALKVLVSANAVYSFIIQWFE